MLKKWLSDFIGHHPVSGTAVLAQWAQRRQHEEEFILFKTVAELPGLVVDIGAHRGQSAVSILRNTRRLKVLSFEPNPSLRASLLIFLLLHPLRFRFQSTAVGVDPGNATLFIPGSKGSSLSPQAALDLSQYRKPVVVERLTAADLDLNDPVSFRRELVFVVDLDTFGLRPDVLKIDAEGSEFAVLKGAQQTLSRHKPALIIEVNEPEVWVPWLNRQGYEFFGFDSVDCVLRVLNRPEEVLNMIGLHADSPSAISQTWSNHVVHV